MKKGKKPIKCGYLLKKGEKNNKWKVRWCAVIEAKFFYFDQIKDQEPIQSFSLNNLAFEVFFFFPSLFLLFLLFTSHFAFLKV